MISLLFACILASAPVELTPGQYLELGMVEMSMGNTREAITYFESALGTGQLNGMGKAMVYWNLALLYEQMPYNYQRQEAGNYLLGFIVYAQDIMDAIGDQKSHPYTDFASRMRLKENIPAAEQRLEDMWTNRNGQIF